MPASACTVAPAVGAGVEDTAGRFMWVLPPLREVDQRCHVALCGVPGQGGAGARGVVEYQGRGHKAWGVRTVNGLAQWTCGQQPTIAFAALVKDDDLDVALKFQVLQTIVADQDIEMRMGSQQGSPTFCAITTNGHGGAGVTPDQHGLVAGFMGAQSVLGPVIEYPMTAGVRLRLVPARQNAGLHAACLQVLQDGDGGGGFARPADNPIAHHQHGYRQAHG
jgi:hypothetical protein